MTSQVTQLSRSVAKAVHAAETPEGVGATVRRSIGSQALRNLSPFLMLDHAAISPGSGFPDHPHRGQTTVTYVLEGKMQHEDFLGNSGILEKSDVQWMTAGRGIVHSEMPLFEPDAGEEDVVEGLQLWVDLPKDKKYIEPSYQEKKAEDITTVHPKDGVEITIISGESHGATGFVRPVGGCWYIDIKLQKPGISVFQLIPEGWTAFVYIITGTLQIDNNPTFYAKHHTLVFTSEKGQNGILLSRPDNVEGEQTRVVLIAGEPLDQPVIQYGPFVVTSQEEAMKAVYDYRKGVNGFEKANVWKSKIGSAMKH
ncbi:hypothetical protein M231_05558 [Tremella mesenterica]|uniref:Pirin n=1 Tax=Tremella mesenterica TaxID=5217 RepID=A0A4Q1BHT7_TREME|nr:uncharacterized protein TREMEDRAFT_33031 [Tremella mesenterica DSM 1558]EIW67982.1 hypothetical protein TREMEDRAFT_33031 [Tremella mesenterica DSM 1558]RXK37189.1 hypothetical protein M231_05558 [Tremella mesenterica]